MRILLVFAVVLLLAGCQSSPVKSPANTQPTAGPDMDFTLRHQPPRIFVRQKPAHLVQIDGEQLVWARIKRRKEWVQPLHEKLRFAINANDDLFYYVPDGTVYLRVGQGWWKAGPVQKGKGLLPGRDLPWQVVEALPEGFELLPTNDSAWRPAYDAAMNPEPAPGLEVITVYKPAELVQLDGAPRLQPVPGTTLQWVANANRPLFFHQGRYYLLLSGRWFASDVLTDQARWQYATPELPQDFSRLPAQAPWAALRANVPGTPEAQAALEAWHELHRRVVALDEEAPPVEWIERPRFEPVEGTRLRRAVTTHSEVLATEDHRYWRCENRAWYASTDPKGPWKPATELPDALLAIPEHDPMFHCRFLWLERVEDGRAVFAHTQGYGYRYPADGVVMEGSGHPYATEFIFEPFWQDYRMPIPHPHTYGAGRDKPLGIWYLVDRHDYIRQEEKKPGWHDLLHGWKASSTRSGADHHGGHHE